jgi:peroxiredoxin
VAVSSTMLPLGTEMPRFALKDVRTGVVVASEGFDQEALLVIFMCNHCPYVKRIQPGLVELGNDYARKGVAIVGISSNDPESYPEDSPEELAKVADELGYQFPLLFDETQEVARQFTAACTPDFFLFDSYRRLVYRGQFDEARPSNDVPVTGADVRRAIEAVLAGQPVVEEQRPSLGCSIKWKSDIPQEEVRFIRS